MLFFLSLVTFVQAFVIRNAAENAAYFGARRGIIPGTSEADIRRVIAEEMGLGLVSDFRADIDRGGDDVKVVVSVSFKNNAWATGGFFPDIGTITQTCILKKQDE